jgi:hypothetical protein
VLCLWFSVSSFGHCIVFHITSFVSARIFLLLDVELSNLCSLRNFDLYMFNIEFILEKVSKKSKHKGCAIKKIEHWYNVIVESVFVDWFLNACKYV